MYWFRDCCVHESGQNGVVGSDLLRRNFLLVPLHGWHRTQVYSLRRRYNYDDLRTRVCALLIHRTNRSGRKIQSQHQSLIAFFSSRLTGTFNLIPLMYAIPLALNTEAILHSNNTRDIESDRRAGCVTLAVIIGQSASHLVFALLLFIPYIMFFVLSFRYSYWLLLPLITLRKAFLLEKDFRIGNLALLPRQMAKLNLYFGIFYVVAIGLTNRTQLPGIYRLGWPSEAIRQLNWWLFWAEYQTIEWIVFRFEFSF